MISGANRGIGLAIARELKHAGLALSLGIRRLDDFADPLAADADVLTHPYDARDRGAAKPWVDATIARFGRIDVPAHVPAKWKPVRRQGHAPIVESTAFPVHLGSLNDPRWTGNAVVNNAGIARFVGLEDGDEDDLDDLLAVNVTAPFRLIRAALPYLKVSGRGRVINVASLSGKRVMGLNAGYQMSKHAVVALTHAVRRIGWPHGIRATALCPGFVDTDLTAHVTDVAHQDMTDPKDLAKLVATVVALPNTAAVAELLVNCRYEHML
jgi:NAD(P)-dependent dehydrogenase (short-subunit alcohol dehydrogenase family)